ncbi:MAG TPA: ABC transporter ATP-binding protein [Clostridiales bacterium]|nr:ABC transporter ATP-binding protein [Clostridiales bacterium]
MGILHAKKLQAGYESHLVFQELDLTIAAGKITTIIGPNGCGKSTLLKTMGRILKPRQGTVYLQGQELSRMDTMMIARKLTLLPQNPAAPGELKVEELVAYGRFPHCRKLHQPTADDRAIIEWAMEVTQVAPFRQREIGNLSGGERQKVWLAMALAQETQILLLDEPMSALDMTIKLSLQKEIKAIHKELKTTVFHVTHDIEEAVYLSDKIGIMKGGRLLEVLNSNNAYEVREYPFLNEVFKIQKERWTENGLLYRFVE